MTYVNDPIGDLLTRIRNAQHVNKSECLVPSSKMKMQICELLKKEGWIADVSIEGEEPMQYMRIRFSDEKQKLTLTRVSKPGRRVYAKHTELRPILNGFGIAILTTSQGLMTDVQARKKSVGGEILCTIA